jgi:membrane-anchored protein YejM (alkaline phosphatase superfamily)
MDFNIFVLVATIIFYVVLRYYKYQIEKHRRTKKKQSNFIYVLFVPILLYLTKFMYILQGTASNTSVVDFRDNVSEPLLTIPYPESSNFS